MSSETVKQIHDSLSERLRVSYYDKERHGDAHSECPALWGRGRWGKAKWGDGKDVYLHGRQEIHAQYITSKNDVEVLTSGFIVKDKSTGRKYRICVKNGVLGIEAVAASPVFEEPFLRKSGWTHGEIFFANRAGEITALAPKASGDVLTCMGPGQDVAWQSPGAPGAHASSHEPGGADEIGDIDILNTGVNLSGHESRHVDGGADPIDSPLKLAAIPSVTQSKVARGVTSNPTTTSTSFVDLAEMQITLTTEANANVLIMFTGTFQNSSTGVTIKIRAVSDGSGVGTARQVSIDAANYQYELVHIELVTGLSAGSHTFEIEWCVSGGTGRAFYTQRSMVALELKR